MAFSVEGCSSLGIYLLHPLVFSNTDLYLDYFQGMSDRYGGRSQQQPGRYGDLGTPQPGMGHQGAVVMVYSLNMEKTNCDKLFNLFCLYGNVVRVSKPDTEK